MKITDQYLITYHRLLTEFKEKYFKQEDWDVIEHFIVWEDTYCPHVVEIADMWFDTHDMYEALHYDISEQDLMDWYWYKLEAQENNQTSINLVHWHKWARSFEDTHATPEEIKECEDNVEKAKKELKDAILRHKQK